MFFSKSVKTKEAKANRNKYRGKNGDPHQNTGYPLRIKVHKEVGVDQNSRSGRGQNGGVEFQNSCVDQEEHRICKRKACGSDGIIPLALLALIEQEPIGNIHDRQDHVEGQAANAPVELRIASLCPCKHNAKAKKVADVGKVYVKVPTEQIDVIKNAKAGNAAHKGKRSINCLIDQLCGSVLIICILLFF